MTLMSFLEPLSLYFKPDVRTQGEAYFAADKVYLQSKSDIQVQAFVKGSSPVKVRFISTSIASSVFQAECNCPSSQKGNYCKHIWACLLAVEVQHPDFLNAKIEISKTLALESPATSAAKDRQSEYRKEQYQKQKNRSRELKEAKKAKSFGHSKSPPPPSDVQQALTFFEENGFHFSEPLQAHDITNAWKTLSRVFHPDKGGTHAEALALNENYEVLTAWLNLR